MLLRMLKLSVGKGRQVMKQLCLRYYIRATVATERAGYVLYRALVPLGDHVKVLACDYCHVVYLVEGEEVE